MVKSFWRCFSSDFMWLGWHTLLALCVKHLMIPVLILGWWLDLKLRYRSVCVGFLYKVVDRNIPSLCTNTSKKGSLPSFPVSMVNSMLGLRELMWERKPSRDSRPWDQMTKVSSTYLYHREGRSWAVSMAIVSKNSMYKSANTGESGQPIGAPLICS